ncbi:glycoside hydrolase family 3 C-terminal domain-containing protein, partial [Candidatus Bathyarchaeota archaeon]|nr:glycoside hydrolase family 3 C-terminal domain-containing protein [Candidatus Bathyarchaeota archaeon]
VTSTYQGLKAALPQAKVILEKSEDVEKVKAAAAAADVAVVVVGYNFIDEGEYTAPAFDSNPTLKSVIPPHNGTKEADAVYDRMMNPQPTEEEVGKDNYGLGAGGDRRSLRLRPEDVEVIKAAAAANPRTVVSIVAAGAVIIEEWKDLPAAIVLSWYAGCEGGLALADLLLGKENFGGRLPFSIPVGEEHLPEYDIDATEITYDRWFGQRLLDRLGVEAAYPLGFGLSYTTFSVSGLEVEKAQEVKDGLQVSVRVVNTGARAGRYVAQVYGVVDVPDWPKRSLLGFQVVSLEAGEEKKVDIPASTRPLQRWKSGSWTMVSGEFGIEVGAYSGDTESARAAATV